MKSLIYIAALLLGMTCGAYAGAAGGAADFSGLQRLGAAGIAGMETAAPAVRVVVDDPDAVYGDAACGEALSPDAPYGPAAFKAALERALRSKALDAETLADFLFPEDIKKIQDGSFRISDLSFDDCTLTKDINASLTKPVMLYGLTGNGETYFGGMALYKGDVFVEGFYRNRISGVGEGLYPRRKYSARELLTKQPWFEWTGKTNTFTPHAQGAALQLIRHLSVRQGSGAYVSLYRGTNEKYSDARTALSSINAYAFDSYGAVFTTPDYKSAKMWASPVVLSSRIPMPDLINAASQNDPELENLPNLYLGIEYTYIEAAFLYKAGATRNLFFDNIYGKCVIVDPNKPQPTGAITEICK